MSQTTSKSPNRKNRIRTLGVLVFMTILLSACNLPGGSGPNGGKTTYLHFNQINNQIGWDNFGSWQVGSNCNAYTRETLDGSAENPTMYRSFFRSTDGEICYGRILMTCTPGNSGISRTFKAVDPNNWMTLTDSLTGRQVGGAYLRPQFVGGAPQLGFETYHLYSFERVRVEYERRDCVAAGNQGQGFVVGRVIGDKNSKVYRKFNGWCDDISTTCVKVSTGPWRDGWSRHPHHP